MALPARSRRTDILRAAETEFAAVGFTGARMERIAAAAQVSKQLVFHYFGSKEKLFAAAVDSLLTGLEAHRASATSPIEQVRVTIRGIVTELRALPGVVGILADSGANPGFPEPAAASLRLWQNRLLAQLEAAIQDGQRRGYFRDDVEPRAVSEVALAAVLGRVVLAPRFGPGTARPGAGFEEVLTRMLSDYCAWR